MDFNFNTEKLKAAISDRIGIDKSILFNNGLTFSEILEKSEKVTNSVDLLEAIAGAMCECGLDDLLELPVFTLDHQIDDIINSIEHQLSEMDVTK
ncbi:MAG: hypothetical protein BWK73_31845 [Thiothrix lacustris]|uniref:Carrier domain-containing protein n=1 Tax=Thiothrix lacustris TaxID=525917 RepID=A0A1Y1QIB8_9GAMM|nr:MAG: hypothetical protein BWK73_31845 [Thiothrix lacustris]